MNIGLEAIKLNHSAPVVLYVLDLTRLGGPVQRFCPQVNELHAAVTWQGHAYAPFPIKASGYKRSATGAFARPKLQVSNVLGTLGSLIRQYNNLRGGTLVRKRTYARFLDAVNFAAGNAEADPLAEWPDEVWTIDRCTGRTRLAIEWELANPLDVSGALLPGRTVDADHCPWVYRSSDCGYTGGPVAKADDTPTSDPALDACSQRCSGCKLRFGAQGLLPGGFFPGVGLQRSV